MKFCIIIDAISIACQVMVTSGEALKTSGVGPCTLALVDS